MIELDDLAGGFAFLIILSLLFLAIGFLSDSVASDPRREEVPPTRGSLFLGAFGWLCLAAGWMYWAVSEWREATRDWVMISLALGWALVAVLNCARNARNARKIA